MSLTRTLFRQRLKQGKPLLLDGAMGTVLYELGAPFDRPLDLLNLDNPKLVADVHRAYIEAGADMIETNTFGANRFKLGPHSAGHQAAALNSAAVSIARRVIDSEFRPVWLAGSVGPLDVTMAPLGRVTPQQVRTAFIEQIAALVDPHGHTDGVDLLVIETMSSLSEIRIAIDVARHLAPELPIVAQMTFNRDDRTLLGHSAEEVALQLQQFGVDVIGVNCGSGPAQILRLLHKIHMTAPALMLAASPNAGWPEDVANGRVLYPATPRYFADHVPAFQQIGVRLFGGCCGTSAAHIAAMRQAIDQPPEESITLPQLEATESTSAPNPSTEISSRFAAALTHGEFIRTVEMIPPKGVAAQPLLAGGQSLKAAGANLLTVADMPQARMRMSGWAAAHLIQQQIGVETLLHFPTRGRSLLRIQADLLAIHALGLRNVVISLGDRAKVGDYPSADNVYDIMPGGLIQLIKHKLNAGVDQQDEPLDHPTRFVVGGLVNLTAPNQQREMRLLREQTEQGVDFALSRPVFDVEATLAFLQQYRASFGDPPPIIISIQPLYNLGMAEYLHNEVPGMSIPDEIRQRMRFSSDPAWMGVGIAQEILWALENEVQGINVIPHGDRYDLAAAILDEGTESDGDGEPIP